MGKWQKFWRFSRIFAKEESGERATPLLDKQVRAQGTKSQGSLDSLCGTTGTSWPIKGKIDERNLLLGCSFSLIPTIVMVSSVIGFISNRQSGSVLLRWQFEVWWCFLSAPSASICSEERILLAQDATTYQEMPLPGQNYFQDICLAHVALCMSLWSSWEGPWWLGSLESMWSGKEQADWTCWKKVAKKMIGSNYSFVSAMLVNLSFAHKSYMWHHGGFISEMWIDLVSSCSCSWSWWLARHKGNHKTMWSCVTGLLAESIDDKHRCKWNLWSWDLKITWR